MQACESIIRLQEGTRQLGFCAHSQVSSLGNYRARLHARCIERGGYPQASVAPSSLAADSPLPREAVRTCAPRRRGVFSRLVLVSA